MKNPMRMHNKNGSALIVVIVMFVVIMILSASALAIFSSNLRQTVRQEEMLVAHYVALSGIDMGVAALLQEGIVGGPDDTLLYEEFGAHVDLANTPVLTDTLALTNGEAAITIRALDLGERWVEVHSVGTVTESGAVRTIRLRFVADNPAVQHWNVN